MSGTAEFCGTDLDISSDECLNCPRDAGRDKSNAMPLLV